MKLAIDVGGVLFQMQGLTVPEIGIPELVPYTQEILTELALEHELWILSFCGPRASERVRAALREYSIQDWIPEERWLFVSSPKLKGPAMMKHGLDCLIDDNQENVSRVRAEGHQAILFTGWPQTKAVLKAALC